MKIFNNGDLHTVTDQLIFDDFFQAYCFCVIICYCAGQRVAVAPGNICYCVR